jgi:hypothetical protein
LEKNKKIPKFSSITAVIHYSSTTAQPGLPKSAVHRFRAPFLAPFFWRSKRKESKTTQTKKNSISVGETKERRTKQHKQKRTASLLEKQKKGREIHTTSLALLCDEIFSRPIGNSTKEKKKIPKFSSITAVIHYSSTTAQPGLPKSAVHRFRAPFLCSFLLEKQKKGEQNNTNKKEHTSFGETIPRPVSIGFVQRQAKRH